MLKNDKFQKLDWSKNYGLIPAIVQNANSGEVLMLGYMNKAALVKTNKTGYVTFFSRSKNRLWTKGEQSGNTLTLINWHPDCDFDTLLILAIPKTGLTCHKKTSSCFHFVQTDFNFLYQLEKIISTKKKYILNLDSHQIQSVSSYTSKLFSSGIARIAQKVGEEGLETALAAVLNDSEALISEAADLVYHLLVLLQNKSLNFNKILQELRMRNNSQTKIN